MHILSPWNSKFKMTPLITGKNLQICWYMQDHRSSEVDAWHSIVSFKAGPEGEWWKSKQAVCPRHWSLGYLNYVCFIQPATDFSAVFQDASRLHALKLHHGIMTRVGSRMPRGSLQAEQRQLWINEQNGHKLIANKWWAEESKVILNGIRDKICADRAEFGLACRKI